MNVPTVMWKVDAGGYCGVLMPRHVMRKIVRLQAKHQEAVRATLEEHKSDLISYNWTINKGWKQDGSQITVYYPDEHSSVDDRIRLFRVSQPTRVELWGGTRDEAEKIATEIARGER